MIDSILKLPFSDDVFTIIRALYNGRATQPRLKKIVFVLLGVLSATELIRDRTRTPYNIGVSISLEDIEQNEDTVQRLKEALGENTGSLIDQIFYWTNGQPFLVQKLAQASHSLSVENRTVEEFEKIVHRLFFQQKIEQDTHLKHIQNYILNEVASVRKSVRVYRRILRGHKILYNNKDTIHNGLKLSGLVRISEGNLVFRNSLYKNIFTLDWTYHYCIESQHVCTRCDFKNEENAEYCTKCGEKLIRRCPECGIEQELHHKHCPDCGADLDSHFDALDTLETLSQLAKENKWSEIIDQFKEFPDTLDVHTNKGKKIKEEIQLKLKQAKDHNQKLREIRNKIDEAFSKGHYEIAITLVEECLGITPHDENIKERKKQLCNLIKNKENEDYERITEQTSKLIKVKKFNEVRDLIFLFIRQHPNSSRNDELENYLENLLPLVSVFTKFRESCQNLDYENSEDLARTIIRQTKELKNANRVIIGTNFTWGSILSDVHHALYLQKRIKSKNLVEATIKSVTQAKSHVSCDTKTKKFKLKMKGMLFAALVLLTASSVFWLSILPEKNKDFKPHISLSTDAQDIEKKSKIIHGHSEESHSVATYVGPTLNLPFTIPEIGIELVSIRGGEFSMGPDDGDIDRITVQKVILTKPF